MLGISHDVADSKTQNKKKYKIRFDMCSNVAQFEWRIFTIPISGKKKSRLMLSTGFSILV
jgi:hypothetical protein